MRRGRFVIVLLMAILCALPARALADPVPPGESQPTPDEQAVLAELFTMNRTLEQIQAELTKIDSQWRDVDQQLTEAQGERNRLDARRQSLQVSYGKRLRYYHEQGHFAPLGLLLNAKSLSDFLFRLDTIGSVLKRDATMLRELRELKAAIGQQETLLASKRAELTALREMQRTQETNLRAEIAKKEAVLSALKEKRAALEAKLDDLELTWRTSIKPMLEALGRSLRSSAGRLGNLQPDGFNFSLTPPQIIVKVSARTLNEFFSKDAELKGLIYQVKPGQVNLEGQFQGVPLQVTGSFKVVGKATLRYEPTAILVRGLKLSEKLTAELLSSAALDVDLSSMISSWNLQEVLMEDGMLVFKAGL